MPTPILRKWRTLFAFPLKIDRYIKLHQVTLCSLSLWTNVKYLYSFSFKTASSKGSKFNVEWMRQTLTLFSSLSSACIHIGLLSPATSTIQRSHSLLTIHVFWFHYDWVFFYTKNVWVNVIVLSPSTFPNSFSWARVKTSLYKVSACLYFPCLRYADA